MTSARKHFISGKIDSDDFSDLKKEYKEVIECLNIKLNDIKRNIAACNINERTEWYRNGFNLSHTYKNQGIGDKRYLVNLFSPTSINPVTKCLDRLAVNRDIINILTYNK
ncbi:hypothetical protein [Mucilaginibacter endophyticus]|uniref:hypothetical protein n=1 Tax=Mucilaginibacter endophyticus TaxID=2675003 RepID=UPI001379797A|nr:hypothetical protein [Mucilaginibacter endophyticus]